MSGLRVPWHRSLFVRLFGMGALIAVVAVLAATWATVGSTTVAVRQAQQQSLHADATTYDTLIGYAATHHTWSGARSLVDRLARESGHRVTVTDRAGHALLDSGGPARRVWPVGQARATLDALDVDPALLRTATASQRSAVPSPPVPTSCAQMCPATVVPARSTIDRRVVGPFGTTTSTAWHTLRQRVDACLRRVGLPPVVSVRGDFAVVVGYPQDHDQVAGCVETSRRAMLTGYVAPAALLFVDGGNPTANVFWDLSGPARLRIALLAAAVLAVTLALSALLAGYVVGPLRRMALAARRAGDGDLTARVPARRGDEIGQVARAFNRMADRRQQLEDARRRLVTDVSHELRTPLANVRGWIEAAQDGLADPGPRLLDSLYEETLHLQQLVEDLHQLSRGDAGELRLEPETIELDAFLAQVADSFRATAGGTLTVACEPDATVRADPVRLRQAVVNLVANALRHTPDGGTVTLTGAPGQVRVADTGEGIPVDELDHVFERFRRADPSRSRATGGSGLGLAIVRQIAEAHGGTATIASTPGVGTTVTLRLPESIP